MMMVGVQPRIVAVADTFDLLSSERGKALPMREVEKALEAASGATVDFVDGVMQSGFRLFFEGTTWDDPVAQKVQDVIDRQINPGVASHGGAVTLDGVKDGVALIRFGGGCHGCGAADVTLKQGIDRMLRENVPEIVGVQDVTDHTTGENPYYAREENASSPLA